MQLLHVQKRDNIEFYLCCMFQRLLFSLRRKTDVTGGVTDRTTVCRGSARRHSSAHKMRGLPGSRGQPEGVV